MGVPADHPPTLAPGGTQGIQPVPEYRNYAPSQSGGVVTRQKAPQATPNTGTNSQGPVPLTDPTPATPVTPATPLKPVPDLDAANGRKQIPASPSLFDPRDRTASLGVRRAWAVSPIVWPDSSRPLEAQTVAAAISIRPQIEHQPTSQSLAAPTDDGWRTVRP